MDTDFTLVYNPKYWKINGKKTLNKAKVADIFGAREGGVESGKLIEKPGVYTINPSEVKKFRTDIANYLLKKYGFLRKVEARELDKVLEENKDKAYKCPLCDFETDTKIALAGHQGTHKLSEEAAKILSEIPEAKPSAYVIGAEQSPTRTTQFVSIESTVGIPESNKKDGDNVEWYGEGLETNRTRNGMQRVEKGGTPGVRPGFRTATL